MTTEQIYALVNDVNKQAFGAQAITVADTQGLISLGNLVLASNTNVESYLNALSQRIGRTVVRFRMYRNKLDDMVLDSFTWGAILQKINLGMPEAQEDPAYNLVQGQSVDMFKVNKLPVDQKLFVTRTPYLFEITIPRFQLRESFLSEAAQGAFISSMFGKVRNKIEVTLENLGRLTIAAGVSESSARKIDLVTEYNGLVGTADQVTVGPSALLNEAFNRYALRRIKEVMDDFTDMSVLHNDGTTETFTPYEDQRLRIISKFERALETTVEWAAFNEQYVKLSGFTKLNFWQAEQSPYTINVNRPSTGDAFTAENVVAVLHDRDAMGVYQEFEDILTSPVNSKGAYYNQDWHRKDGRMLDTSENMVYFTLN
jgi:hypothetical protein